MIAENIITSPRFNQDQHNVPMFREQIVCAKVTGRYLLIRGVRVPLIRATARGISFQLLLGYGKTIVSESRLPCFETVVSPDESPLCRPQTKEDVSRSFVLMKALIE